MALLASYEFSPRGRKLSASVAGVDRQAIAITVTIGSGEDGTMFDTIPPRGILCTYCLYYLSYPFLGVFFFLHTYIHTSIIDPPLGGSMRVA